MPETINRQATAWAPLATFLGPLFSLAMVIALGSYIWTTREATNATDLTKISARLDDLTARINSQTITLQQLQGSVDNFRSTFDLRLGFMDVSIKDNRAAIENIQKDRAAKQDAINTRLVNLEQDVRDLQRAPVSVKR